VQEQTLYLYKEKVARLSLIVMLGLD